MLIPVLDHGSVELLDKMGTDLTTVNAARVSFGQESAELTPKDERLIRYLAEHEHTSPFRHATLMMRFTAPIFVARQLHKHIVGLTPEFDVEGRFTGFSGGIKDTGWNEQSYRYTQADEPCYMPKVWREQSSSNKQGSEGQLRGYAAELADRSYRKAIDEVERAYDALLGLGVAREQARIVLPVSLYTRWVWTGSLQAFLHIVKLRAKPDAQYEARQYGLAVRQILAEHYPAALQYWELGQHG